MSIFWRLHKRIPPLSIAPAPHLSYRRKTPSTCMSYTSATFQNPTLDWYYLVPLYLSLFYFDLTPTCLKRKIFVSKELHFSVNYIYFIFFSFLDDFSIFKLCCDNIINNRRGSLMTKNGGRVGDGLHETWAVFLELCFESFLECSKIDIADEVVFLVY